MKSSFYLFSPGKIRRKQNTVFIERTDGSKKTIPVEEIDEMFVFSEVDINSKLMNFLGRNGIAVHFFDYYGNYTGTFLPREEVVSGLLIVNQVEHYTDSSKRLFIARKFVESASFGIRRNLSKRGRFEEVIKSIKEEEKNIRTSKTPVELMTVEARIREKYFSVWGDITNWKFERRTRHPPSNELNAIISFTYGLLYAAVLKEIRKTALHPAVSFLHEPSERRFSLALDIADIFKPIFADRLIFRMVNKGMIGVDDFEKALEGVYLKEKGRKKVVEEFDKDMESTIYHRTLKRKVKHRSLIRLELYKLIKHLIGDREYEPIKVWW